MGIINNDVFEAGNGVQKVGTYISFNNETLYLRKTGAYITILVPAPAPAGLSGPSGPSGPSAPVELSGASGASGPSGPSAPVDLSGESGPSGPSADLSGPSGPSGPSADLSGESGASGASGPSADLSGASGSSAPADLSGASGPSAPVVAPVAVAAAVAVPSVPKKEALYQVNANYRIFWDKDAKDAGKSFMELRSVSTQIPESELESNLYSKLYDELKKQYANSVDE